MIKANEINYIVLYSAFYLKKSHKVINISIIVLGSMIFMPVYRSIPLSNGNTFEGFLTAAFIWYLRWL